MTVAMLPVLGVDGLLGVGASMTMDAGQFDSVMHAHVLLDNPRTGVLEMIAHGVGRHDAGAVGSQQRGPLRDAALGLPEDGQEGGGGLRQLRRRRTPSRPCFPPGSKRRSASTSRRSCSPRSTAGRRCLVWIEDPITPQSQHMMLALKLRDPKVMQAALERSFKERERFFKKELYSGKEYYQAVIPGPPEGAAPAGGRPAASLRRRAGGLPAAGQPAGHLPPGDRHVRRSVEVAPRRTRLQAHRRKDPPDVGRNNAGDDRVRPARGRHEIPLRPGHVGGRPKAAFGAAASATRS